MNKRFKGFTLIELLIVMAILGVLAVVVLVAINPVQQLARTRDAGRKSGVTQIGHAAEAYYTSHNGSYMDAGTWLATLSTSGELASIPQEIAGSAGSYTACSSNEVSNWCYNVDASSANVLVYTKLESQSEISKCASGDYAWFVFSSAAGRGGLVCDANEPTGTSVTFTD